MKKRLFPTRNKNTTMISIRVPNGVLEDIKRLSNLKHFNNVSQFIIYTMSGVIVNDLHLLELYYENIKTDIDHIL